jgi:predicted extracellular nuclease
LISTNYKTHTEENSMNKTINKIFSVVTILALMLMALPMQSALAAPTELFFSEYIEGSSNNKALEIYNGTGAAINLTTEVYNIQMFFNGSTSAGLTINLTGSVAAGDVFVVAQATADPTILAQANQTNGAGWFNGDDAVVLRKGTTVIDVIGQIGNDPGTEWGTGLASTADNTLNRKSSICAGDPDGSNAFDPSAEWDGFATNTFDGLGSHTVNCGTTTVNLSIDDISANEGDSDTTTFDFTVSLSAPAGPGGVTFDIATADDTATVAGNDYVAQSLTGQTIPEGQSTYTFTVTVNGDTSSEANETFFVNITNVVGATVSDGQGAATIVNDDVTIAFIHDIQGTGAAVTGAGPFTVEAIVVGDYQTQGSGELRGFFIQEEDADADTDPATSEGIFVFCSNCPTDVNVGDKVRVTGTASEFFGMSQLNAATAGSVSVLSSGNTLPTPAAVDLPASGSTLDAATFEHVEGMLVNFTDTLYVSEYFELARYGQLILTADARPRQFTDAFEPSVEGYAAYLEELNSTRIILDDDNNLQNDAVTGTTDEPYFWPRPGLSNTNFIRGGDSITGLTGVMHWSFAGQGGTDAWRIRPVEPAFEYEFTSNNERTSEPEDVGGSLKVASFNVLNYFTTINSRGADSAAELDRQRAKTAAAICAMDADIVGLIEIENNGGVAINDLLNGPGGINDVCGTYEYIETGVIGTDEIIQAFIYRPASVSPVGDFAVLDSSVDSRFLDDFNRPAIAQTFQDNTTGGVFTVVINHLKSKGSDCNAVGDPDIFDGQGNCNVTRTNAATALVDWLASDPTDSGDEDFLIMGDLNSYRNEDPIDTIEAGADDTAGTADDYVDLLDALNGSAAYSYVFDGQLGYLDTGLASSGLLNEVTGVTEWHINADEIPVFDYNDEIDDGSNESSFERESTSLPIYEPNAYRSSDHDPVIIGLDLIATCNGLPATIIGTPGDDVINGTNGNDVIVAMGGNDVINGGNGNDVICGNAGDDTIDGGNLDDLLFGGFGNDTLSGGNGNDSLDGEAGDDSLVGDKGDDTLTGGTGADSFSGGQGVDTNTDFDAEDGDTSDGT